jgi:protein ImuB
VTIVPSGQEEAALKGLPVEALRLDPATRISLRRLGLKTAGDLIDKPRAPLSRRFGAQLVLRLDQALGRAPEPIDPIALPPVYDAARQFLDPIMAQAAVVGVARRLFEDLAPRLERDGVGARSLRLGLYRVDGEAFFIALGLAAPTRNATYVERLFGLRLERLSGAIDPGFGFDAIRLGAVAVERLRPRQGALARAEDDVSSDAAIPLIDSLSQRLGRERLSRPWPHESHIPERAVHWRSDVENAPAWPQDKAAPRPALLLPKAEPADVLAVVPEGPPRRFRWRGTTHRVAYAQGPERIAPEWWRKPRPQPTRDYYIVEDESGHRFWLFREGLYGRETSAPRWFVHGFFA